VNVNNTRDDCDTLTGVNVHAAANVHGTKVELKVNVETKQNGLEEGHPQQLEWRHFADHGAERDEDRCGAEEAVDEDEEVDVNLLVEVSFNCFFEESNYEHSPLNGKYDQEESKTNSSVSVLLQESHQISKTYLVARVIESVSRLQFQNSTRTDEHHDRNVRVERIIARHHIVTVRLEQCVLRVIVFDDECVH